MVTVGVAPRIGTPRNEARPTLGPFITAIAHDLGFDLFPWQTHLSDVSMEMIERTEVGTVAGHSRLRLNAQYVGALVGRQSGKTTWCVSRVVAQCMMPDYPELAASLGLVTIKPQHVGYTAQTRTAAVSRWMEHVDIIMDSPLRHYVDKATLTNGREQMRFVNGSVYQPMTPNRTSARGLSLDLAIVDEALAHPLWLLPAIRPTMAQRDNAIGCVGAQFVVISNAGDDDSELLNRMQELGHLAVPNPNARHVWMEWSAPPECDPFDEAVWHATMPTLGLTNGIDVEFLRTESETLRQDQFMREYLCVRIPRSRNQVIPNDRWNECVRNDVLVPPEMVLGLDVMPDRSRATVMACGRVDDYLPIELVDSRMGLEWVIPRVVELANRWSAPVALDVAGPAANMIPSLEALGVMVIPLASREVTNAAAIFYDAVMAQRICHMNDYRVNDAVTGASKRAVGERWAFDRKGERDITPLVAASFAVWAIETNQGDVPTIH